MEQSSLIWSAQQGVCCHSKVSHGWTLKEKSSKKRLSHPLAQGRTLSITHCLALTGKMFRTYNLCQNPTATGHNFGISHANGWLNMHFILGWYAIGDMNMINFYIHSKQSQVLNVSWNSSEWSFRIYGCLICAFQRCQVLHFKNNKLPINAHFEMFFFLDVHIFRMYRQLCEIFRVILRHKTEREHYFSIANWPKTFKHSQNSIPYVNK